MACGDENFTRSLKKERSCCEEASSSRLRCTCRIIKELIADTVTIIVPL